MFLSFFKYLFSFDFLWKIFLVWLIFHFFLHTLFTFSLNIDSNLIWLWKEFVIVLLIIYLLYYIITKKEIKFILRDKIFFRLQLIFIWMVLFTFFVNYFVLDISISQYILAFRYDFLWYLIFFIVYNLSYFIKPNDSIIKFYWRVLKIVLLLWIIWYLVLIAKPWALKLFWYDNTIFEWEIWMSPPAAYYTQKNQWLPRNQFLFERPISYWFFLVAFFPLFYMLFLRKKSFSNTWFWWWIYGLNVISTFSRAAWWAWFFEVIVLALLDYRNNIRRFLKYILLPISLSILAFIYFAYDHIIARQRSNTWHIEEFLRWREMLLQSPLIWKWAWYVWPASFWGWWIEFNPENQFLQIAVEFWSLWFVLWFSIFFFFMIYWFIIRYFSSKNMKNDKYLLYVIAFWIWLVWLSIQWMVLHSFVDRMIVYPFMFLFAICVYLLNNRIHDKSLVKVDKNWFFCKNNTKK